MMNCQKNIIKFGEKLEKVSKTNLMVNLYTTKNI